MLFVYVCALVYAEFQGREFYDLFIADFCIRWYLEQIEGRMAFCLLRNLLLNRIILNRLCIVFFLLFII